MPPGVFWLNATYPGRWPVNVGDPNSGEYRLRFDGCAAPCEMREVARISYGAFSNWPGMDHIMTVSGIEQPDPVIIDCRDVAHTAPMGGHEGGVSGIGVASPPGALMLNPTPPCVLIGPHCGFDWTPWVACDPVVDVEVRSLTTLKSRFKD